MSDRRPTSADDRHPPPRFALREGRMGGGYAVAMVNHALKDYPFRHEYPWHLSIEVRPKHKTPEGLPTAEEAKVLNALEDRIDQALRNDQPVHFAARETLRDVRRLHWYLANPAPAAAFLREIIGQRDYSREFEFMMRNDPQWNEVASLLDYSLVQ